MANVISPLSRVAVAGEPPGRSIPPFAPSHHFAPELTSSERCDHERALAIRGICPGVAVTAESDEAAEVEIRVALSTLEDVMHLEAGAQAAGLADPMGADLITS